MERRLAAILAADMVGYSRLMGANEEDTIARQKAHRGELFDPLIAEHGGRLVKTTGDGLLVEFPSVVAAVQCALKLQEGVAIREDGNPEDRRMHYRIGVNLGDIVIDGDDILGDGVNVAARLEALARAGEVCVSRTVFDEVKAKVDFGFVDLGPQQLKNIAEPVHVYRVAPENWQPRSVGLGTVGDDLALPEKPSIAILPFKNLSGDPAQDYLADGFRLDVQATLVKVTGLFLITASTVNSYRDREVSAEQAGRELGVRYVLEGAVQRSDERIRITVQLTDCATRQIIWAERYDRQFDDKFTVQDELTAELVTTLDVKLVSGEEMRANRSTLKNAEARDCFYRGLSHFYAMTKEDSAAAREMFENVARLQPDSPVGPTYVCFTHWFDVFRGWADSRNRSLKQAAEWAGKAIKFYDNNGLAHIVLASAYLFDQRHDEALATCREAYAIRPNCPIANGYLANILLYCGHSTEAVARVKDAIRLSPYYPPWLVNVLAAAYRESGDVGRSISAAKQSARLSPEDLESRLILCSDYLLSGRREQAEGVAREIVAIDPEFSVAEYAEGQPYKDEDALSRLVENLRDAGLPG